jgi:two-component system response regulator PrrA
MNARRSAGASGTILVVDEDGALRRSVRKWLEARDFLVLDAGDGDAERIARVFVGPIHLLLVDVSLAGMAGSTLAAKLRAIHAELLTVYMSTRSQPELVRKRELRGDQPFLRKPFDEEQLIARLQETLMQSS